MFLNSQTKNSLRKGIGLTVDDLVIMDHEEEIKFISKRNGKAPIFSKTINKRGVGRGNPLITRKRLCTMEEIDKRIALLK